MINIEMYYFKANAINLTSTTALNLNGSIYYRSNLYVNSPVVVLQSKARIAPSIPTPFCVQNAEVSFFSSNCLYPGTRYSEISNNSVSIVGSRSLTLNGTMVSGSLVVLCSPRVYLGKGMVVSATGLGCPSGTGQGAGQSGYGSLGSGGGGNGGYGGSGINAAGNGGSSQSSSTYFNAGSGGGVYSNSNTIFSEYAATAQNNSVVSLSGAGGGVIVMIGTVSAALYGVMTSNGMSGDANCGGGAGGTIAVNTMLLSGTGPLQAVGGTGGSNPYPGGGGGGGYITLYNPEGVYISGSTQTFTYTGSIDSLGGSASAGATSGSAGDLALPACPPGYGNSASSDGTCPEPCNMCQLCGIGFYSYGNSDQPCSSCNNRPNTHSYYTTPGQTGPNCLFDCDPGYSTMQCTQFDYFLSLITVGGFAGAIAGIVLILFLPLMYYRLKFRYGWFESKDKKDNFIDIFIKEKFGDFIGVDDGNGSRVNEDRIKDSSNGDLAAQEHLGETRSQLRAREKIPTNTVERRKACRLSDQDMHDHACRINLLGSNSPLSIYGNLC